MTTMKKTDGAFLTIGELAAELGLPQHILRYWESRFPQLRPLQRAGNRRYYRPADVELARRIDTLLNVEGFTVRGAQKALEDGDFSAGPAAPNVQQDMQQNRAQDRASPPEPKLAEDHPLIVRLETVRAQLAAALEE